MKRFFCVLTIIYILIIVGLHQIGVTFFNSDLEGEKFICEIISSPIEKEYTNSYKCIINGKKYIIYIKKSQKKFEYGDIIEINGKFQRPSGRRNYKGFDYSIYLKSKKIFGSINAESAKKIDSVFSKNYRKNYGMLTNLKNSYNYKVFKKKNLIINRINKNLSDGNNKLLIGILLGDTESMPEEIKENFRLSNLSHMIAVSGDHFSYIILAVTFLLRKVKFKRLNEIITIFVIIFFMSLTGMTASVVRAGIMAIILILGSMFNRKNDILNSMALSLFIQMIFNPYVIFDIGLQLSYGGVIGITFFNKIYENLFDKIHKGSINSAISVTLAANTAIMPIMIYNFNTISFTFVISNLLAGSIMAILVILGFISVIFNIKIIYFLINIFVSALNIISKVCAHLPLSNIYVKTPFLWEIILVYFLIFIIHEVAMNKEVIQKKSIKIIASFSMFLFLFANINIPTNNLIINFIDVGQGDSCLIRNQNVTILIDSGGSTDSRFDVGKNTLFPYLLDRRITKLDYIFVSHFDADHSEGFLYVMKNLKIKNAIIPTQAEESKIYEEFIKLCEEKKINLIFASQGDLFKIANIYIEVMHPNKNFIAENKMNNNALVMKLSFYNYSMLFTGDIEKEAEGILVNEYHEKLNSSILKVGHHGSKTSSSEEFLNYVNPKIALIGVGENNKFGHPNDVTISNLEKRNVKIFRTDKMGEIYIIISKMGKMKINYQIKNR